MKKHLLSFLLLGALPLAAAAQTTVTGDVAGSVTDPTGAPIPGSTVTLTSKADGSVKTTVTDQSR